MGCDIHMYVEYASKKRLEESKLPQVEGKRKVYEYWSTFGGRMSPGRNYLMFGLLSKGVRSDLDKGIEPKGLPEVLGYQSQGDAYMYITDSHDGDENSTTLERALSWKGKIINDISGKPRWTEHPDWHSHTWLTTKEYASALRKYHAMNDKSWDDAKAYKAILAAMKSLESDGETIARVVLWFDN